jgi:hypothetical protein
VNTTAPPIYRYPYEEFADHIKAMRTVSEWEYTSRFGHLGHEQTNRARSARVLEYFSDCYDDQKEAVHKAGLFLSIHDYIGRNVDYFRRKGLVEEEDGGVFLVEPNLLRAVHHAFTARAAAANIPPKRLLALTRAYQDIEALT